MNSTQWHILWNAALLPPQTMLPTEDFFKDTPHTAPLAATHLFGFPSPLAWEIIMPPICKKPVGAQEESNTALAASAELEFTAFI